MSERFPKISIVVHSFNRASYLRQAIDSILNQNYPNLELVVVDDNSTDESWNVIESYGERISYKEKLSGSRTSPVHALNVGFSHTTGEVMGWLNNKNMLMPGSLFALSEVFSELREVEWLTGIGLVLSPAGVITDVIPVRKGLFESMMRVPWNIQQESTFWRRSLWERAGSRMDEVEYPWAFDVALWNTKFFHLAELYQLNTVLGAYRKLPSAQSTAKKEEFYGFVEKSRQELWRKVPVRTRIFARIYWGVRFLKPLFRNLPDTFFSRVPLLSRFAHKAIRFQNTLSNPPHVRVYLRNPFRTTFPW